MTGEGGVLQSGRYRSWAATHAGTVRAHNEDAFLNRPDLGLWAVADGAGGHMAGDVASRVVIEALDSIPPDLNAGEVLAQLRLRVAGAHAQLREDAAERGAGAMIATTLVVLVARQDHFACLWAGDSRAYLLRGGALSRITRDHSLVQEMVDAGAITEAQADGHPQANVITRAVGAMDEAMELDKIIGQLLPGDRFLLCSDGLCKVLDDAAIIAVLAGAEDAPAERLVAAALARMAGDNVTVVMAEVAAAT